VVVVGFEHLSGFSIPVMGRSMIPGHPGQPSARDSRSGVHTGRMARAEIATSARAKRVGQASVDPAWVSDWFTDRAVRKAGRGFLLRRVGRTIPRKIH